MTAIEAPVTVLVVRSADTLCALPVEQVAETLRLLPIEAAADAPSFVLGMVVVRGDAMPVIDLAAVMGLSAEPTRLVTVALGSRRAALAVTAVLGVMRFAATEFAARPPILAGADAAIVTAFATRDRELYALLDAGRLIPDGIGA